jgi:glycerol uptake operon antiterminator
MRPRRSSKELLPYLSRPVIPYLTQGLGRDQDVTGASILFVGAGELADLPALTTALTRGPLARVPVLLHIDMIEGLANDEAGLKYVATLGRIDGVITVRQHLAPLARKLGLLCVLRLFLQDGRAVERGLQVIERSQPDAVELLPGVAFLEVADRFRNLPIPTIAGGLIRTPDLVQRILAAGAKAVSTTNTELWAMNRSGKPETRSPNPESNDKSE